ncbi:Alkane 1-monooxygenase 2 [Roseobacter fucihabitans]|uniref:Alkane 1-monooxygenase 2 n=1 Tax=Roseobacter fucihabitans TaxID=1537242 RepID=A0ABZ2BY48_9RHOB|nr:alkane 1-monooxygenase [Roseobacter litoralis]MBC6967820.1 Alkane 1-monooxygenase 2 [Roseobacter litoralis]
MTPHTIPPADMVRISRVAPFWITLLLVPIAWLGAIKGGWSVLLLPLVSWYFFSLMDALLGRDTANADLDTPQTALFWYRAVTLIWAPIQFCLLFSLIWYVPQADHLSALEKIVLFFGVGVITGTVGINYSHELMHQKNRAERRMADLLLAMVLYSHFRSEHLLVHHRHVATPRDAVTARYNEGFHRFYPRVLKQSLRSAFEAEKAMLHRRGKAWHDPSNPFFRYWALQALMLFFAFLLAGWVGIGLFLIQAGTAVWQLELVNYIEHYGLTRKHLGNGKYEHVKPHHSWNSDHRMSNWLLINLQRHSDHHYKPDRRFPVLQTYSSADAPQLPFGYPVMTMLAMMPPLWCRIMNPKVQQWRRAHYPEITEWHPYERGENPLPG